MAAVVTGTNFETGAAVTSHAGINISGVTYVSATEIDVSVSVKSSMAAGDYNIIVENPDGGTGVCKGCLAVT